MKIKSFLKPRNIFSIIFFSQVIVLFLYYVGVIKSYKVETISKNTVGYLFFIVVYLMLIVLTSITTSNAKGNIRVTNSKKIYKFIYFFTVIGIIGALGITKNIRSSLKWNYLKTILFTNHTKEYMVYGGGYIPLITMSLISIILLIIIWKNNKKNVMLFSINFLVLTICGILLNSRIMILQPFIYSAIIIIRMQAYNFKLPMIKTSIIILLALFLFIISSGIRDYNEDGKFYTKSKILWGISRVLDYPLTTANYSLEILGLDNDEINMSNVFEVIKRFREDDKSIVREDSTDIQYIKNTYGSSEYTNLGAVGQVFLNCGLISIFIFFMYSILIIISYNSYNSGRLFGLLIYPIVFYSILEFWRLFSIGTEQISIILVVLIIVYFFIKDCFYYSRSESQVRKL